MADATPGALGLASRAAKALCATPPVPSGSIRLVRAPSDLTDTREGTLPQTAHAAPPSAQLRQLVGLPRYDPIRAPSWAACSSIGWTRRIPRSEQSACRHGWRVPLAKRACTSSANSCESVSPLERGPQPAYCPKTGSPRLRHEASKVTSCSEVSFAEAIAPRPRRLMRTAGRGPGRDNWAIPPSEVFPPSRESARGRTRQRRLRSRRTRRGRGVAPTDLPRFPWRCATFRV